MNQPGKIAVTQVDAVATPPRARVEDAQGASETPAAEAANSETPNSETMDEKLERKRDYLEGFLSKKPQNVASDQPGGDLYEAVVAALKEIYDPEIPVNIYDLGLIYAVEISPDADVAISMTLTTPHCPVAESMPGEVELRAASVPGVRDAQVNLIWDPPWDPGKMTDEARLELGML